MPSIGNRRKQTATLTEVSRRPAFGNKPCLLTVCAGGNQVSHRRAASYQAVETFFQFTIGVCKAIMLSQVLGPGHHDEGFDISVWFLQSRNMPHRIAPSRRRIRP